jgi:hypothetical protein
MYAKHPKIAADWEDEAESVGSAGPPKGWVKSKAKKAKPKRKATSRKRAKK